MRFAVIMAGGAGTRLWPLSRKGTPKQLLRLIDGKSLLRIAFERLGELVVGTDPVYGPYVDNTGIALAVHEALSATADCLAPAEPPLPPEVQPAAQAQ